MRYRALTPSGDYNLGATGQFLLDSPLAVGQAIMTRLRLMAGEWFLDADEGTAYQTRILGYGTQGTRDIEIKRRILDTPGVQELLEYRSEVAADRSFMIAARVSTIYGVANLNFSTQP